MRLAAEAERAGAVYAELFLPWSKGFDELDGLTMPYHPGCLACDHRPDIPFAFAVIYAVEDATLQLPLPICEACAANKTTPRLQKAVRKSLRGLMPNISIEFVMEAD